MPRGSSPRSWPEYRKRSNGRLLRGGGGPGGPTMALVYSRSSWPWPLPSVLHIKPQEDAGRLKAVRMYFAAFSCFFSPPCLLVVLTSVSPFETLSSFGWTGRAGLGCRLDARQVAARGLAGSIASRDPAMDKTYPFAKAACADARTFVGYELSYLALYYLPWESVFRGALFLPLVPAIGLVPALAVQTAVSTLLRQASRCGGLRGGASWSSAHSLFHRSFIYTLVPRGRGSPRTPSSIYAGAGGRGGPHHRATRFASAVSCPACRAMGAR
jgi:hypothetical protein